MTKANNLADCTVLPSWFLEAYLSPKKTARAEEVVRSIIIIKYLIC